jgi:hypothetical protein
MGIRQLFRDRPYNDTAGTPNTLARESTKAWRVSGDTQVSCCRKHGLSRHAFQYWKHNLQGSRSNRFIELSRATGAGPGGMVEILIEGGVQIRVPQGVSSEHLHMVLQAVKGL